MRCKEGGGVLSISKTKRLVFANGGFIRPYRKRRSPVDESTFEGTLVLEKLAAIEKVDDFFEALDSDDFGTAEKLMKAAKVDAKTIAIVLRKMAESDGEH
jgi:hypothetical protein